MGRPFFGVTSVVGAAVSEFAAWPAGGDAIHGEAGGAWSHTK
ncbi:MULTISPECIES: hypothetical protein [Mycolicibacterium]|nr:hypothetical protein [Mycolicibacterium fortuitum]